jgi:hypothetical protein
MGESLTLAWVKSGVPNGTVTLPYSAGGFTYQSIIPGGWNCIWGINLEYESPDAATFIACYPGCTLLGIYVPFSDEFSEFYWISSAGCVDTGGSDPGALLTLTSYTCSPLSVVFTAGINVFTLTS